jgi:ATP-dependent DNA helicase RecG
LVDFKVVKLVDKNKKNKKNKQNNKDANSAEKSAPTIHDLDLHGESMTKWIAQFANTETGGMLLFGVADDGGIAGVPEGYIELLGTKIRNAAKACKPAVMFDMSTVKIPGRDGSTADVVVVDIPPSNSLHEDSQGFHLRNGNGALKLEGAALNQILGNKRVGVISADMQGVANTSLQSCNPELLVQLGVSIDSGEMSPVPQLVALGLACDHPGHGSTLSVAGTLLCCDNPQLYLPFAKIVCTHFATEQLSKDILATSEYGGPIQQQIDDAVRFVMKQQQVGLGSVGGRSRRLPNYADLAVLELVVNAAIHRDYSLTTVPIHIRMFGQKRLELSVPGSLLHPVRLENLGEFIVVSNRNFVLCRFLSSLRSTTFEGNRTYCEQRGMGVRTAKKATSALGARTDQVRPGSARKSELKYSMPDPFHVLVTLDAQGSPHASPTTSPVGTPTKQNENTPS